MRKRGAYAAGYARDVRYTDPSQLVRSIHRGGTQQSSPRIRAAFIATRAPHSLAQRAQAWIQRLLGAPAAARYRRAYRSTGESEHWAGDRAWWHGDIWPHTSRGRLSGLGGATLRRAHYRAVRTRAVSACDRRHGRVGCCGDLYVVALNMGRPRLATGAIDPGMTDGIEQAHRAGAAGYNRPEALERCSCATRWEDAGTSTWAEERSPRPAPRTPCSRASRPPRP